MTDQPNETGPASDDNSARGPVDPATASTPPQPPAYMPFPVAAPPKKSGVFGKFLRGIFLSMFAMSVLANVYQMQILMVLTGGIHEDTYEAGDQKERIVIVPIDGIITEATASFVTSAFRVIDENKVKPKAIVLRVNSPGGGVGASDRIHGTIERYKKENPGIPIIASFGTVAASGGYYVSAPCDHIVAEPTCITGSIGVIWQSFTAEELLKKIGIQAYVQVADGSPEKDVANNTFRSWDDRDMVKVKSILNQMHTRFADIVFAGRSKVVTDGSFTEAYTKTVANGATFTTQEAVEAKLVDDTGYLEDAIETAKKLGKISGDPLITFIAQPRGLNPLSLLMKAEASGSGGLPSADETRAWLHEVGAPKMQFLWEPGR